MGGNEKEALPGKGEEKAGGRKEGMKGMEKSRRIGGSRKGKILGGVWGLLLFVVVLTFATLAEGPGGSGAERDKPASDVEAAAPESGGEMQEASFIYLNPLYEGLIDEGDLLGPEDASSGAGQPGLMESEGEYCASMSEASGILRDCLLRHEDTASVWVDRTKPDFNFTIEELGRQIVYASMEETSDPHSGDYILFQYGGCTWNIRYNSEIAQILYTVTYYTTAAQEAVVDREVASVLRSLSLSGKDEDYKIAKVYDYITSHVVYDYTNLDNESYRLKYTAYAALIDGTAVCQGYACLFYRMCRELGLSVRVLAGTGNGGPHAWNIVKIGNWYYDADSTWDAEISPINYEYFLRCDANFADHVRNEEYNSSDFRNAHPMSTKDYGYPDSAKVAVQRIVLSASRAYVREGENFRLSARVLPEDAYNTGITFDFPERMVGFYVSTSDKQCIIRPYSSPGSITVRASSDMGACSASCVITVLGEGEEIPVPSDGTAEITDLQVSEGGGKVRLSGILRCGDDMKGETARMVAAFYDGSGRLLYTWSRDLALADGKEFSYDMSPGSYVQVKAFLLDLQNGKSFAPLGQTVGYVAG